MSSIKLNNGLVYPTIGLGVWLTSTNVATQVVYDSLCAGYRLVDSAEFYGNEKEVALGIARWIKEGKGKREDVLYTSKLWDNHHGYAEATRAINKCMARAKSIEYIDLMLIHLPQSDRELRLGTWKALQEAVDAGKIKSIGVSNYGNHHIQELLDWEGLTVKPVVNQIEVNPWFMRKELVEYCHSKDIVVEAYSPLTRGEKFDDPDLVALAKKYKKSPAQILIRWSLQQGHIVLPKTVTISRAVDNFDVYDFVILDEDVARLSHPNLRERFSAWDPTDYRW